jgi:hypothetical protein
MKGYGRLDPTNRSNQVYFSFLSYTIRSSSSLASQSPNSPPLFDSTSIRGVSVGLPEPRHHLGSLLPDGVPPGSEIQAPPATFAAPCARADRPAPGRGPSGCQAGNLCPCTRSRTVRPLAADRPRLTREHRRRFLLSDWRSEKASTTGLACSLKFWFGQHFITCDRIKHCFKCRRLELVCQPYFSKGFPFSQGKLAW